MIRFGTVFLMLLVLASLLGIVAARQSSRDLFIAMQNEQNKKIRLNTEWGQLELEQSTLAAHGRVEAIARDKLGMTMPAMNDVLVVRQP